MGEYSEKIFMKKILVVSYSVNFLLIIINYFRKNLILMSFLTFSNKIFMKTSQLFTVTVFTDHALL